MSALQHLVASNYDVARIHLRSAREHRADRKLFHWHLMCAVQCRALARHARDFRANVDSPMPERIVREAIAKWEKFFETRKVRCA